MKRTVIDFRRTLAGQWLRVREVPPFFAFWAGANPREVLYWRPMRERRSLGGFIVRESKMWAPVLTTPSLDHRPLTGPCVSWRVERKLQDALEAWEHDQPAPCPLCAPHACDCDKRPPLPASMKAYATPSGPAYAAGELFECDCGRQHPPGWVCVSAYRDQL